MEFYCPKKNLPFRPIKNLDFPSEVQIQTHTTCNARCTMCPYALTYRHVEHGRITSELFRRLIDECAHHADAVKNLKPFLMNEPLMDQRLPGFIRYARERLSQVNIGFSTNGQLLEGEMAEGLLDSGVTEILVNFCGNTNETYSSVMKGLSFSRVRQNVIDFKNGIIRKGLGIQVYLSVVETRSALVELEETIAFWQQYGIKVITTPLNNRGGNVEGDELRVLGKIKDRRVCDRPFYKIYIAYNGDVILCSSDWRREIIVGNVVDKGIHGVWHSGRQKEIRERLLARDFSELPLCTNCDYVAIYE